MKNIINNNEKKKITIKRSRKKRRAEILFSIDFLRTISNATQLMIFFII